MDTPSYLFLQLFRVPLFQMIKPDILQEILSRTAKAVPLHMVKKSIKNDGWGTISEMRKMTMSNHSSQIPTVQYFLMYIESTYLVLIIDKL